MKIEDYHNNLPKMYRVVEVDLDVLRNGFGCNYGVIYDIDTVVKRKVRRVLDKHGWRWALVREHPKQELWDYYFEQDRVSIHEINYEFGLIK